MRSNLPAELICWSSAALLTAAPAWAESTAPAGAAATTAPAVANRPNLLIVFPDQMRGTAMGFMGEEPVRTPALDRFAEQSRVFTQAVSTYPLCSPFRGTLMTGRHAFSSGVWGNCNSRTAPAGCELPTDAVCWSDILKARGYSLGYIGKWHLDAPRRPYVDTSNNRGDIAWNEWCPPERRHGFDYWYAYGTYDQHLRPMYWTADATRDGFHYVDQWGPEHEADQALRFIRNEGGTYRDPKKPFALVISMNPPHTGYELVPPRYLRRYDDLDVEALAASRPQVPPADTKGGRYYRQNTKFYYAQITGVDEQFGRILEGLREAGLEDNTVVLFTSDHGDCIGAHGELGKNNPYEEAMRVPFLIRWPGRIAPGRDEAMVASADICPTLLDLLGYSAQIPPEVEGVSLAPTLRGEPGPRPDAQLYLFVTDGWDDQRRFTLGRRGLRTRDYKLIVERTNGRPETVTLFDRKRDPNELSNVAGEHPDIVRQLRANMEDRLQAIGDPWVQPNPAPQARP
ncbi:MAG: sulfatase [Kiritimatiellae bacterium]|nr:sulfatase [Kiritimatiellia bacterium]